MEYVCSLCGEVAYEIDGSGVFVHADEGFGHLVRPIEVEA